MEISAKTDYAVRALLSLAARAPELVKVDVVIGEQALPRKFVEAILGELRRAGLVRSQRGAEGGYALAKPPSEITLGSIFRAVDGPLAEVRGLRPHETTYEGVAAHLPDVWVAVRASLAACSTKPRWRTSYRAVAGARAPDGRVARRWLPR